VYTAVDSVTTEEPGKNLRRFKNCSCLESVPTGEERGILKFFAQRLSCSLQNLSAGPESYQTDPQHAEINTATLI